MMTKPRIYGLVGFPVKHSLSPLMHNAAFKQLGVNASYGLFEVEPQDLKKFLLEKIFEENIFGCNITIPHKVCARQILEEKFPGSEDRDNRYVKLTGAVNTVKRDDGRLRYCNTDVPGFLLSLERDLGFQAKDKNALIMGCGGAGRAVVAALLDKGTAGIYVYEPDKNTVAAAQEHFGKISGSGGQLNFMALGDLEDIAEKCDLLVNASFVGMKEGDPSPIDKKYLHKDLFVYDVVYNKETRLIKDARSLGLEACGGLGMLLYQGVYAFSYWTGLAIEDIPVELMRQELEKGLKRA